MALSCSNPYHLRCLRSRRNALRRNSDQMWTHSRSRWEVERLHLLGGGVNQRDTKEYLSHSLKNSRRLWRSQRRKSRSDPKSGADFPAAIVLAGKCQNLGGDSIWCCRKISEELTLFQQGILDSHSLLEFSDIGVPKSELPGVQKRGEKGGGGEGERGREETAPEEEKVWEERGPKTHLKNADFGTPMI